MRCAPPPACIEDGRHPPVSSSLLQDPPPPTLTQDVKANMERVDEMLRLKAGGKLDAARVWLARGPTKIPSPAANRSLQLIAATQRLHCTLCVRRDMQSCRPKWMT